MNINKKEFCPRCYSTHLENLKLLRTKFSGGMRMCTICGYIGRTFPYGNPEDIPALRPESEWPAMRKIEAPWRLILVFVILSTIILVLALFNTINIKEIIFISALLAIIWIGFLLMIKNKNNISH